MSWTALVGESLEAAGRYTGMVRCAFGVNEDEDEDEEDDEGEDAGDGDLV